MSPAQSHLLHLLRGSSEVGLPDEAPEPLRAVLDRAVILAHLVRDAAEVSPGQRVLLCDPDPLGFLQGLACLLHLDAVPVPLDPRAGSALLLEVLEQARPAASLLGKGAPSRMGAMLAGAAPLLDIPARGESPDLGALPALPPVKRQGDDEALVIFTSGSTARPKGVALTHGNILSSVAAISAYLPLEEFRHSAILLPLHYGYALIGQLLTTLAAGGRITFLSALRYPVAMADALSRLGPCGVSSVPTSLGLICDVAQESGLVLEDVGYVGSAGARLPAELPPRLGRVFPRARLFNQYGCTEAAPRVSSITGDEAPFAQGSVGRAIEGLELAVLRPDGGQAPAGEEGDVAIRGPSVSPGYLGEGEVPTLNRRAGYLLTGDLGYLDQEGYLYIAGRRDRVIKSAGERVSLDEVEASLMRHPSVKDAAALALPHPRLGIQLAALVVGEEEKRLDLEAHLLSELGAARRPGSLRFVPQIPRGSSGKAQKETLARLFKESE